MNVIELPVQVTVPDLLHAIEQLPPRDLDEFLSQARLIQRRNLDEAALLETIHRRLPAKQQARLQELADKLEAETITPNERNEMLGLVDQTEALDAERAEALLGLAQRRRTSIRQLVQDLRLETELA